GDQAGGEQLVADAASGDWLGGLSLGVHRLDKLEGPLRHAATLFGTGFKILGGSLVHGVGPCSSSDFRSRKMISPLTLRTERLASAAICWCRRSSRRKFSSFTTSSACSIGFLAVDINLMSNVPSI